MSGILLTYFQQGLYSMANASYITYQEGRHVARPPVC